MSRLEKLANEIKYVIADFCGPNDVKNLALTGPVMYTVIKPRETEMSTKHVTNTIGIDLLPLAVARHRAQRTGWRISGYNQGPDKMDRDINRFIDEYLRPGLVPRSAITYTFNFTAAQDILEFHNAAVYYARTLAEKAVRCGPRAIRKDSGRYSALQGSRRMEVPDYVLNISPTEVKRFEEAMYIFETACALFPDEVSASLPMRSVMVRFFRSFAPWVNQQVRCIQSMLENHLYFSELTIPLRT